MTQAPPAGPGLGRWALVVLVGALLVSLVGDGVVSFSLVLDAVASGHPVAVTAVFLAELVPPVVLAPRIGRWIDAASLRWAWVVSLSASGVVFALAAVVDVLGVRIALVAPASLAAVAASACAFKAVPWVAGPRGPSRINGALSSVRSVASLAAPALGGIAHATVGTTVVLVLDAVSFAVLAGAVAVIFAAYPPATGHLDEPAARSGAGGPRLRRPVAPPWLKDSTVLRVVLPIVAVVVLTTSVEGVAGVFWLREVAGNSVIYGLVLAAWAAGAIPGALLAGRGTFGHGEHRLVIGGTAAMGAVFLAVPFVTSPLVLAVMFLAGGAGNGAHNVGLTTAMHRFVPAAWHGRAWSQLRVVINTAAVLGYTAGTPTHVLGPRELIFISGVLTTAVALYGITTIRRLDAARLAETQT